jgi:hypothetical protein
LSTTPQTVTVQGTVASAGGTHLQVRTGDTGPVDLYASGVSLQLLSPEQNS